MTEEKNIKNNFKRLENLVQELEGESLDISESLKKFKEGVTIIKVCKKELQEAQNEFVKLSRQLEEN